MKAALALGIPLTVATALGHQEWALTCSLGSFSVLYGPATAGRFRARLVALVGCGLIAAAALGAATEPWTLLYLAAVVVVAFTSAMVCVALKVGPPGSYFFTLTVGVGGNLVAHGMPATQLVSSVAVGAAVAWLVTMSDVVVSPRGPEERAVDAADAAIAACERLVPTGPAGTPARGDEAAIRAARTAASTALHQAWTTVTDGAGRGALSPQRQELAQRLRDLHERYIRLAAMATHRATGTSLARPWTDDRDEPAVDAGPEVSAIRDEIAVDQLRETSLGRPSPGYLLRRSMSWPHEVPLVGLRVALAAAVSGGVAAALGEGHVYWAVAFAALVLHQGGTRIAQTYRGVQRLLGTFAGLGVFALLLEVHPQGWWLVATLVALQYGIELLVVRNYALATLLITPLALTVVHVGAGLAGDIGSASTIAVLVDRAADTVIAVGVALLVLWTTGRRAPLLIFRAQGRRCLVATEAVMRDLVAGTVDTAAARERRRHLYFELLEYDAVGARALVDGPAQVSPYIGMRSAVIELGYVVLGACWHPALKNASDLFAEARRGLEPILSVPVTQPRSAEAIRADVAAVHDLVTAWSGDEGQ